MPSILENRDRWEHHDWAQGGDEWSPGRSAEGTTILWHRTVLPRIQRFVPTDTILEIGPGFGRWTQYLRQLCRRLILVDLSERCIESCKRRFGGDDRIEYIVNDGASLEQIQDGSVDFIFSFDSLVHAEADAVGAYLAQAAHKLRSGGGGFIHHSNLKEFVSPRTNRVRWFVTQQNWRAPSMSADVFRDLCSSAKLACPSQELINWIGKGVRADRHRLSGRCVPLTDCLSVFSFSTSDAIGRTRRLANHRFVDEWRQATWMADLYLGSSRSPDRAALKPDKRYSLIRKIVTARNVQRRDGWRAVASLVRQYVANASDAIISASKARLTGEANRWFLRGHFGRKQMQELPSNQTLRRQPLIATKRSHAEHVSASRR